MSRRLEVTCYWAYWPDESDSESDFTTDYIVTKNESKFCITSPGKDGPFLKSEDSNIMNDWITDEDGYHLHCDLESIGLKLLDGERVVSSAKVSQDWRQTVVYLMNLL